MTEVIPFRKPSHYVGIGASAGGLEALQKVFQNLPANAGISYIIVQHLSPGFKSLMAEILSKHTDMPVHVVTDGVPVSADTVYLIPPGKSMALVNGCLTLEDQNTQGLHLPIDIFFHALAKDQKEKAIAIILSGTGSDGSKGLQSINEVGGLIIVQEPSSAEFDGMPRNALNTGLVDYTIPPEQMGITLANYLNHPAIEHLSDNLLSPLAQSEHTMEALFTLLKQSQRIDFSAYKASLVAQRIQRRLGITQCQDIHEYLIHLADSPEEIRSLTKGLLIGTTRFFRDEDIFQCLEEHIIPQLLSGTSSGTHPNPEAESKVRDRSSRAGDLRIWVPGCATGEEAYSLAILFDEVANHMNISPQVRIFATDIDPDNINKASLGRFGSHIADEMSVARLHKYFSRRGNEFEVNPTIRQMVIFARQDVIGDPPFSNIDFISCRNLLSYLQNGTQKKTLSAFHYALKPKGILLLGQAESAESLKTHFSTIDERCNLYQKKADGVLVSAPATTHSATNTSNKLPALTQVMRAHRGLRELTLVDNLKDDLIQRWAPNCFIVSEAQEVLLTYGDLKSFSKPFRAGKFSLALEDIISEELISAVKSALSQAQREGGIIKFEGIKLTQPSPSTVTIIVEHIKAKDSEELSNKLPIPGHFIITLQDEHRSISSDTETEPTGRQYKILQAAELTQQRILELEQALAEKQTHLQDAVEALETTNEELHTSNEDLVTTNEALHSANEELQSANEELYVINSEYQEKITELTEINDDLDNILSSTNIGILFLDRALLIRKFTQGTAAYIHAVAADIGRPLHHISNNMNYPSFHEDITKVNRERIRHHKIVSTQQGDSLLIQVLPYEASHYGAQHHNGVVITFTNLSQLHALECATVDSTQADNQQNTQHINTFVDAISTFIGKVRALVVDDDTNDRRNIISHLAKIGHFKVSVTEAHSVETALKTCETQRFDVCLIDYRMGNETALDFIRGLQRRQIKIPTIILSGYAKKQVDHELLSSDIRDFLNKHELSPLLLQRSIQYAISRPEN